MKDPEYIKAKYDDQSEWEHDPAGYLLIRIKDENIEVGLVKKGNKPDQIEKVVTGENAREIYMTIYKQGLNLRGDHMAYLGRELAKAEYCLKNKLQYIQDNDI